MSSVLPIIVISFDSRHSAFGFAVQRAVYRLSCEKIGNADKARWLLVLTINVDRILYPMKNLREQQLDVLELEVVSQPGKGFLTKVTTFLVFKNSLGMQQAADPILRLLQPSLRDEALVQIGRRSFKQGIVLSRAEEILRSNRLDKRAHLSFCGGRRE